MRTEIRTTVIEEIDLNTYRFSIKHEEPFRYDLAQAKALQGISMPAVHPEYEPQRGWAC